MSSSYASARRTAASATANVRRLQPRDRQPVALRHQTKKTAINASHLLWAAAPWDGRAALLLLNGRAGVRTLYKVNRMPRIGLVYVAFAVRDDFSVPGLQSPAPARR